MELDKAIESVFKLRGMVEHVYFKDFFRENFRTRDLGITHIITMMVLKFEGPSRMNCVAEAVDLEKGSFTPVAKHLFELGFIGKSKDPEDRRATIIALTQKGQEFTQDLKKDHLVYIKEQLSLFSQEEQEAFFEAINTVLEMTYRIDTARKAKSK